MLVAVLGVVLLLPGTGGATSHNTSCSGQQADVALSIVRSPAKATYAVGENITLTVTARNHGPCPAPQAETTLTIPGGLTPGATASASDGTYGQPKWTVDLGKEGDPNNPSVETLTLPVTTNDVGAHTFEARRTDGQFNDPVAGNDHASAVINVGGTTTSTTATPTTDTSPDETTTTPGGTTTTTVPTTTTTDSQPVEGEKINAEETTGEVLVKIPGQEPRPINPEGELLPPGTKIDATNGTVVLTSEYNGAFEQMTFWDGAFVLNQKASNSPVTTVKLVSGLNEGGASVAKKGKKRGKKARRLWGKGNKGHYRTTGRSGSATVRGTKWKTVDRPDGSTKFVLKRGKLAINDFTKPGKVDKILKRKGEYIAKPKPRKRRRR